MSGPAPKHPSVRRRRNNPRKDFRTLTVADGTLPAPPWPLRPDVETSSLLEMNRDRVIDLQVELAAAEDGRAKGRLRRELAKAEILVSKLTLQLEQANDAEAEVWDEVWTAPQAILWRETHSERMVAQYVRWKVRAEQGDIKASVEARMLSDRLGLNPLALLRLRVELELADAAQAQGDRRRAAGDLATFDEVAADRPEDDDGDDPRSGLFAVS